MCSQSTANLGLAVAVIATIVVAAFIKWDFDEYVEQRVRFDSKLRVQVVDNTKWLGDMATKHNKLGEIVLSDMWSENVRRDAKIELLKRCVAELMTKNAPTNAAAVAETAASASVQRVL